MPHRASLYAAIVVLAIGASATSLQNGFALDDIALVAENARVHSLDGWWRLFATPYWPPQYGASLYRPIVTLGYALQWTAGHGAPWVFHVSSIFLYAAASALVLALLLLLLPAASAFMGAALFAVHPVHVEAVANVVGQSELLAALATLSAVVIYVSKRQRNALTSRGIAALGVLYAIACLSKEHGILLPALLVAIELLAIPPSPTASSFRERIRSVAPLFLVLGAIAIAYIIVRTMVLGDALGEKHLVPVYGIARLWVMLAVAPHWVRLLMWPAHLSADYSPHEIAIPSGPAPETVVGFVLLTAAIVAFFALGRPGANDARRAIRTGLAWLAITLLPVSNLFSVMLVAERTLFFPSVGAMLVVGSLAALAIRRLGDRRGVATRVAVAGVSTLLVSLGAVRSSERQRVWRDDVSLFAQTVKDAPTSYRAQFFYGQILFANGRRVEGEHHLALAIALNPTPSDVSPLNYLATQYRDAGMCPQAIPLYERAFAHDAARPDVRYGLAECLLEQGRVTEARVLATEGVKRGDLAPLFRTLAARVDSSDRARSAPR